ncbi:hypothetical protein GLAREA_08317 [Glarea lozoyensis ATCC 20868]|uniref:Uncharacterized protein n=1 Tax=Glarea lozoyensis (strain ATCC 20868 / MF5171) TaxID=1116229 RepID=S3CEN6_GLAL2|nr:uncharacterized protein GLAREA_08317 [Glarea lozoyensis ATCC 20868]EPE24465.1 hypothetical protein GLAREA_08317 [Glarea lozoyensis ATCC 20868]
MDYPPASLGGVGYDVRYMIYSYVLLPVRQTQISILKPLETSTDPDLGTIEALVVDFGSTNCALFRVNKQISNESLQYFYTKNTLGDVETDDIAESEVSSSVSNSWYSWQGRLPARLFRPERQPSGVTTLFMRAEDLFSRLGKQTSQDKTAGMVRYSELKILLQLVEKSVHDLAGDDDTVDLVHDSNRTIPSKAFNMLRVAKELMDSLLGSQRGRLGQLLIDRIPERYIPESSRNTSVKPEQPQTKQKIRAEERQVDWGLFGGEAFLNIAKSLAIREEPADWKRALAYLLLCCKWRVSETGITDPDFSFDTDDHFEFEVELFDEMMSLCLKLGLREKALVAADAVSNLLQKQRRYLQVTLYPVEKMEPILVRLVDLLMAEKSWDEANQEVRYALHRYPGSVVLQNTLIDIKARQAEAEAEEKRLYQLELTTIQLVNSYISDVLWGIAINEVNCALAQHPESLILSNALSDIEDLRLAANSKSK